MKQEGVHLVASFGITCQLQMRVGLVVEEKDCLEVGLVAVAEDLPMVVG